MKILSLCISDNANLMKQNTDCLRKVGQEAFCYKTHRHNFNYEEEAQIRTVEEMKNILINEEWDVIQFFHGQIKNLNQLQWQIYKLLEKRRIGEIKTKFIVYQTGSDYRNKSEFHNSIWNRIVDLTITNMGDLYKLGGKNMQYVCSPCEENKKFSSIKEIGDKLVFSHYPSDRLIKGTEEIENAFKFFSDHIKYRIQDGIKHENILSNLLEDDIYVELYNREINGKEYGTFGTTALEAASSGCIVVTQDLNKEIYESIYGKHVFFLTHYTLKNRLQQLILMKKEELMHMKMITKNTILERHSKKATGSRILELLNKL